MAPTHLILRASQRTIKALGIFIWIVYRRSLVLFFWSWLCLPESQNKRVSPIFKRGRLGTRTWRRAVFKHYDGTFVSAWGRSKNLEEYASDNDPISAAVVYCHSFGWWGDLVNLSAVALCIQLSHQREESSASRAAKSFHGWEKLPLFWWQNCFHLGEIWEERFWLYYFHLIWVLIEWFRRCFCRLMVCVSTMFRKSAWNLWHFEHNRSGCPMENWVNVVYINLRNSKNFL